MSRKIFISVLGTGNYSSCIYGNNEFKSTDTRFVQQAAMEYIGVKDWKSDDCVYLLLTDTSRSRNWESRIDERTGDMLTGLHDVLESMNLPCQYKDISIGNGMNETFMWQIFQQLYHLIHEDDEIYMDLTHGFRFLPMLVLVFGNYAKFLKNVTIRHLSYGNFEVMRELHLDYAPLVNLLPLSELQDWTFASADFLKNGDAHTLQQLCKKAVSSLFQQQPGIEQRQMLTDMNKLVNALQDLTESMRLCRGNKILESDKWGYLQDMAEKVKSSVIPPMTPLMDKIQSSFTDFKPSVDVTNGYYAFIWCFEHNLYQQAITILLETLISHIAQLNGFNPKKKEERSIVARAINALNPQKGEEESDTTEQVISLAAKLREDAFFNKISCMYWDLCKLRNDINHSGLLETAVKPETFTKRLGEYITIIREVVE